MFLRLSVNKDTADDILQIKIEELLFSLDIKRETSKDS